MAISEKLYEQAIRTVVDYAKKNPEDLTPLDASTIASAELIIEQYERENR